MKKFVGLMMMAFLAVMLALQVQPVSLTTAQSPLAPPASQPMAFAITGIEPSTLVSTMGGTLSVYGGDFTENCVVRLVGYGLLPTTFVNESALTAQVPPGVPAGLYDVEVADGTNAVRVSQMLKVIAPTPTPAPPSAPEPPPPGRPILTIRNYSVEPQKVRAGQEFMVSVEIYNNGSRAGENTMAVFPGTTFVPVGEAGHLLWQLHINHTVVVTQKLRVPAGLSSAMHHVHINLSANDWEGNHYDYPQTVPVEVVGNAPVTGQPKVTIEGATTTPPVLIPGDPFTLTLHLANRGSRTAVNVFARCASDAVIPTSGSDAVSTPQIAIEDVATVTLPLLLDTAVAGGRQKFDIALAYEDYSGGTYNNQETIGVDINASLSAQPQLLIQEYHTQPDFVCPGDTFTLTVIVSNVGGGLAERLTLALGGENGAALEPFSPLQAGNVSFVAQLPGGATSTVQWRLIADGAAQAKAYNLPLALAYDDAQGGRHSDTQRLSLIVRRRPELQATFYREPEDLGVEAPTAVSLEVLNVGGAAVNIIRLQAMSEQMDIETEGMPFMGPVEAGSSAPLDVTVTPHEPGILDMVILVTYRDDFNQTQVLSLTLPVNVAGGPGNPGSSPDGPSGADPVTPPPPSANAATFTFWQRAGQLLKGFLGFGS